MVLDLDGTLLRCPADGPSFAMACASVFGVCPDPERWGDFEVVTDLGIARDIARRQLGRGPQEGELRLLEEAQLAGLRAGETGATLGPTTALPGAGELLAALLDRPGVGVAVATGNLRSAARHKLQAAGLHGLLAVARAPVVTCEAAATRAGILRVAIEQLGDRPGPVVAVGDAVWDVEAARDLGIGFLGVGDGPAAAELRRAGASAVTPDFRDLGRVLELLQAVRRPAPPLPATRL